MRKIIATARVSLDSVMQGPGAALEETSEGFDLGGWITQFRDAKGGGAVLSLVGTLDKPYDLLLGRKPMTSLPAIGPKFLPTIQLGLCSQKRWRQLKARSPRLALNSRAHAGPAFG
jgi:hypothetical protein